MVIKLWIEELPSIKGMERWHSLITFQKWEQPGEIFSLQYIKDFITSMGYKDVEMLELDKNKNEIEFRFALTEDERKIYVHEDSDD